MVMVNKVGFALIGASAGLFAVSGVASAGTLDAGGHADHTVPSRVVDRSGDAHPGSHKDQHHQQRHGHDGDHDDVVSTPFNNL